jgi:hypothetical protein
MRQIVTEHMSHLAGLTRAEASLRAQALSKNPISRRDPWGTFHFAETLPAGDPKGDRAILTSGGPS